ncbi:hypothetical protein QYE76_066345 [Lolium multiflorum]|uniref:Uncharacterized protein n=1 Tax=Lolium multiflorum TaxID=4521 RepID=A0AAD8SCQ4_LOLMU|nr:hypothetical protein QYE76_066345 [Lolium multiflorum]
MHAVTAHWPRQYVEHSNDAVLPLQPYQGVEHLLPALYTLDKLPGLPLHRCHRHDQTFRHGTARTPSSIARHRTSLDVPSRALASPRRRLQDALHSLPLRSLQRPRHRRPLHSTRRPSQPAINRGDLSHHSSHKLLLSHLCPFPTHQFDPTSPEELQLRSRSRRSPQILYLVWSRPEPRRCTRGLYTLDNIASTLSLDRRRPTAPSDPLPLPPARPPLAGEEDEPRPCDPLLIRRSSSPGTDSMEYYDQTESYELGNGGSLVFERDLYLVSEKLERPPPQFHGVRIHNTPAGEQQWMITADLKGSPEPPISERILFSFKACNWVDGLAHALQEGLARVCGQNIAALQGTRFAHFARHDTMGEPMALSSHPVLKIHVEHLDFMLHETRKDLELTRVHAHRAQMALAHHADAIRLLAKDRRSLRLQRVKNVATITRLREKIRTLEVTVRTQQDQIQEMEEDGEDIQGGDDFLSDDNDFEDDEFTDEEDYEFLEAAEDGIIPIDVDEDDEE